MKWEALETTEEAEMEQQTKEDARVKAADYPAWKSKEAMNGFYRKRARLQNAARSDNDVGGISRTYTPRMKKAKESSHSPAYAEFGKIGITTDYAMRCLLRFLATSSGRI